MNNKARKPGARQRYRLLAIILLLAANALAADDIRDPREFFFTQSFGDLPEELAMARQQGKQGLFLFFEAENCPYCIAMLKRVFNRKQVQDWYGENFVSIAVDIHGDVEIKDLDGITLPSKVFSEQRKVSLTPTLSFIDLDGTEVYRRVGMVKTPEEFLLMGEYIAGKHYFDTEFKTFAKTQGMPQAREVLTTPGTESEAGHARPPGEEK